MEAATASHQHHEMPTSGRALTSVALSATLHCLTGCAIGEVAGMAIGTALGWSDLQTIALAVGLAFLFGYGLTSLPLLRAGLTLGTVVPIALASDTLSIAVMEIVDNGIMLVVPGAMEAGLDSLLFWGALSVALVIAGAFALPVNRYLIARGRGHAVVHETGIHGGPPVKAVAAVAVVAAVFGTTVLVAEAFDSDPAAGGHEESAASAGGHGDEGATEGATEPQAVRGLAVADDGLQLELRDRELPAGRGSELSFRILDPDGKPVRDFEVEHERRMHLILVRRDTRGFQHLHPTLGADGSWRTRVRIPDPGSYRVFADFKADGENRTLAADLAVDGEVDSRPLPRPADSATTAGGYEVRLAGGGARAGREAKLDFSVARDGRQVETEPYLGAGGHLVALREGDLAFLHVHPTEEGRGVSFETEFPTSGRYRLFLQFKHAGRVRTAAFTEEVER